MYVIRFDLYLDGHHQDLLSEAGLTEFANIRYSVPQGSILSHRLFLIFINDKVPLVRFLFIRLVC